MAPDDFCLKRLVYVGNNRYIKRCFDSFQYLRMIFSTTDKKPEDDIQTFRPSSIPGPRKDSTLVRFALSKLDLKTNFTPQLCAKEAC